MENDLLAFWDEAALDCAPYVHPRDAIPENCRSDISSYLQYLTAFRNGVLPETEFHLGLLPQPYHGDLENSEILLLLINPGLSACDYHVEQRYPAFREGLIRTIRQERRDHLFLNPEWAWTSGFVWWESKFREVARVIAGECFNGNYGRALADLAHRVASIDLSPYHSLKGGSSRGLESADAARRFVAEVDPGRTVIVMRGVADWALPDAPNIIKYSPAQARKASLGSDTTGGKAILERYKIRL